MQGRYSAVGSKRPRHRRKVGCLAWTVGEHEPCWARKLMGGIGTEVCSLGLLRRQFITSVDKILYSLLCWSLGAGGSQGELAGRCRPGFYIYSDRSRCNGIRWSSTARRNMRFKIMRLNILGLNSMVPAGMRVCPCRISHPWDRAVWLINPAKMSSFFQSVTIAENSNHCR